MKAERIEELLAAISRVRLAVVGDYFLDRYGRGVVRGLSRETGRPVIRLDRHSFRPGGTGNVAANAADLGAKVFAAGVLGADRYAELYRADLADRGIDAGALVTDPRRLTPSFEKFQVQHRGGRVREFRIDVDNSRPVSTPAERDLCEHLERLAREVDGLVAADYEEFGCGVFTGKVLETLLGAADTARVPALAMSRTRVMDFLPLLPVQNEYEVVTQTGTAQPGLFEALDDETVERGARVLLGGGAGLVFVTRGERGISVFSRDGGHRLVPTRPAPGPVDTVGAGDTVLAAAAAALAAGAEPAEAAFLANCAAHVTVRKLGTTGTASPDEIRRACAWMSKQARD